MTLSDAQQRLNRGHDFDFSGLTALFVNCTLKASHQGASHTQALMDDAIAIMRQNGVAVTNLRAADHRLAFGVQPDMREHGASHDDWPEVFWPEIRDADILVLGTPIWLGEESSLCRVIIERLYAHSAQRNDKGQYVFYGKTGGCMVTGNEDGIKHVSMSCLYAMQHVGYTIPPQADCGWIGEAGPGPSYGDTLDDGSRAGFDNDFTRRNLTFMTWNLMHVARLLKRAGGLPAHGNTAAS
ncbi:NAD(P)H-dependent oxidoreductase [Nitratireductor sp. StC3]|uniref:flavodoxin family protein n=1 Tax=Nitratireductor sp. StC3 TaxID=2126741 RepID=UPI000D0C9733|nr:NAD(P)H-dependent oxidoreductase [Nitratireductor sp. StC3]PSM18100.1 flavodoxin [Nitratireductor sp. StC3]